MPDPVSVLIPAYNEADGVAAVIDEAEHVLARLDREYEILLIDDGSTDATADDVARSRVRVLRHPQNLGYGAALKTGVRCARYECIVTLDADGTYPVEQIPRLIEALEEADMVVGARTGSSVSIPFLRRPAKWLLQRLAEGLTGQSIPDLNSGMRAVRRSVLMRYLPLLPLGFSFTTTLTLALVSEGHPIRYLSIDYFPRTGRSKIRPIHDTLNFLQLILRTVAYFAPLKVFLSMALLLFAAAVLVAVLSSVLLGRMMDVTAVILLVASLQTVMLGLIADLVRQRSVTAVPDSRVTSRLDERES